MTTDPFATRLKELREQAGLTQQELADRTGMNRFGIAKLEQGVRGPSWQTVKLLAEALGVDCTAFNQEPAPRETAHRGRPRKDADQAETPPAKPAAVPQGKRSAAGAAETP